MLFLATHTNRLDKKGRISVPAAFRGVIAEQTGKGDFFGIVAYPSLNHPCIEACGLERIHKVNDFIESLPPLSPERDAMATIVFGESVQLAFDAEGRVIVPEKLWVEAGIKDEAVFVGKGEVFEIWEPKRHQAYTAEARSLVKKQMQKIRKGGKA